MIMSISQRRSLRKNFSTPNNARIIIIMATQHRELITIGINLDTAKGYIKVC